MSATWSLPPATGSRRRLPAGCGRRGRLSPGSTRSPRASADTDPVERPPRNVRVMPTRRGPVHRYPSWDQSGRAPGRTGIRGWWSGGGVAMPSGGCKRILSRPSAGWRSSSRHRTPAPPRGRPAIESLGGLMNARLPSGVTASASALCAAGPELSVHERCVDRDPVRDERRVDDGHVARPRAATSLGWMNIGYMAGPAGRPAWAAFGGLMVRMRTWLGWRG